VLSLQDPLAEKRRFWQTLGFDVETIEVLGLLDDAKAEQEFLKRVKKLAGA